MPLPGLHFRGTVAQRLIANHAVDPGLLSARVPPDAELCLHGGKAWLSACFVQMLHLRPVGVPRRLGVAFRYLVHRTKARIPFPDGSRREAVVVLEAYGDPMVPRLLGRTLGGAPFRPAHITWTHEGEDHRVRVTRAGDVVYDARFHREDFTSDHFAYLHEAEDFILGLSFGSHHDGRRWRLFLETHDPWEVYALSSRTARHALLEGLGTGDVEADHVLGMEDVPHYFARPISASGDDSRPWPQDPGALPSSTPPP